MRNRLPKLIFAVLGMALLATGSFAADDRPWELNASLMAGNNDNFFNRGEGAAAAPASGLQQLFLEYAHGWDVSRGELIFEVAGTATAVSDIDNADYEFYQAGLLYKQGRARWYAQYFVALNRLFSEDLVPSFFDENSFEAGLRYSLGDRAWLKGEIELEKWTFEEPFTGRDADVFKYSLTGRYALSDKVATRVALLWEDRDAVDPKNNRVGPGFSVAFELQPWERVDAFVRYRNRQRDYKDATLEDRNFGREDSVVDINLSMRYWIGATWGVQVTDNYRDGDSTRAGRSFDSNAFLAGVFISL